MLHDSVLYYEFTIDTGTDIPMELYSPWALPRVIRHSKPLYQHLILATSLLSVIPNIVNAVPRGWQTGCG